MRRHRHPWGLRRGRSHICRRHPQLHRELHLSMLVVTHDIGVVKLLASQTMIMQYGQIVEQGLTDQILEDPQHPYTQELISAAL